MNKKDLIRSLQLLESSISVDSIGILLETLDIFSPIIDVVKTNPDSIVVNSTAGQTARNNIISACKKATAAEKKIRAIDLISQSNQLKSCIRKVSDEIGDSSLYLLASLDRKLDEFLHEYELHVRSYSVPRAISLSTSSVSLRDEIQAVTNSLKLVLRVYNFPSSNYSEDVATVDLYFSNVKNLHDYSAKLGALADIYTEVLSLYNLTESDYPLLVEHIESGSLWVKVAGHGLTAAFLTTVLSLASKYYHDTYTTSGKLAQLPVAVSVADELLTISKMLEEDGVDTSEIKENIGSATRKISKKLDLLLGDQPTIEINDMRYDVGEAKRGMMIEDSTSPRLEGNR